MFNRLKMEKMDRHCASSAAEAPPSVAKRQDIEAEQALLGAVLINNDAFYRVSDFLKASDFASSRCTVKKILRGRAK